MKLAIIGGSGLLGSTTAFYAGAKGLFEEIHLIGRRSNMIKSHVMDMDIAMRPLSRTRICQGDYDSLRQCDIILIAAGAPEHEVENRNEYLDENLILIKEILRKIKARCEDKVIVGATNPVDVFNYLYYDTLQWPRQRFIGYNYNDTIRMRWALGELTGRPYHRFEAYVLGEHGENQVPVFECVKYEGVPVQLSESYRHKIEASLSSYFRTFQALHSRRTCAWTSAVGLTAILEAIVRGSDTLFSCSAVLSGEYGQRHVSLGVPVRLGPQGIHEIFELDLQDATKKRLDFAGDELRMRIDTLLA